MKDQYQEEISRIHVTKELLEETKKAMKEEEAKEQKRKKLLSYRNLSIAAAAVFCLCILVPMMARNPGSSTQIQLSRQEQYAAGKIVKNDKTKLDIKEVEKRPQEFDSAKEVTVNGIAVFIVQDVETGYLKAYYEKDRVGYEVLSETDSEDELTEAMSAYLK